MAGGTQPSGVVTGTTAGDRGVDLPDGVLARAMLAWTALFGSVSFEVFGQYGADTLTEPRQLFDHHLDRLVELTGLNS